MLDDDVRDSNEESIQSQIDMQAGVVLPIRGSLKDRVASGARMTASG